MVGYTALSQIRRRRNPLKLVLSTKLTNMFLREPFGFPYPSIRNDN